VNDRKGDEMGIKDKFFGMMKQEKAEEGEDTVEVSPEIEEGKVNVKIENLRGYSDTDRVQQLMREGNVVFLKIKELRGKDINELKRAVDKLRKTCTAMNGDIVGVDEDFLIITPKSVTIYRGKAG
jgi:hypothetical protein